MDYDNFSYDGFHPLRRRRGDAQKDSKSALKTRLWTMDQTRTQARMRYCRKYLLRRKKTFLPRKREVYTAFVAEKEIAKQRAKWGNPTTRETLGALRLRNPWVARMR